MNANVPIQRRAQKCEGPPGNPGSPAPTGNFQSNLVVRLLRAMRVAKRRPTGGTCGGPKMTDVSDEHDHWEMAVPAGNCAPEPPRLVFAREPWRPRQSSDFDLGCMEVTGCATRVKRLPRRAHDALARLDSVAAHASQ